MTRPSPRQYEPAAFSVGEVITGGALTLGAYLVVSFFWYWILTLLTMSTSLGFDAVGGGWVWAYFVWVYGAFTAVPAVIIGTVTASLVGRAMEHRASFPRHLIVQGLHAYVIGAIATVVCLIVIGGVGDSAGLTMYPLLWGGPAAAFAALIGWRSTVAIARRRDRRRLPAAVARSEDADPAPAP
ncbi:MAG TPA: hypothetical protein VNR37_08575 [Microbacteriaceae bacterium]|nr:hypothetical protein [Microbacteriaceae bacterium]